MAKLSHKFVLETYLSWKGRIGRGEFWAFGVALSIAWFIVIVVGGLIPQPIIGGVVVLAGSALMLVGYAGLMVKRGHDRGRPAAFSIIILTLRVLLQFVSMATDKDPGVLALQAVLVIYVLVDYAFWPGQKKANRYGPPPGGVSAQPLVLGAEAPAEPALPSETPKA